MDRAVVVVEVGGGIGYNCSQVEDREGATYTHSLTVAVLTSR